MKFNVSSEQLAKAMGKAFEKYFQEGKGFVDADDINDCILDGYFNLEEVATMILEDLEKL
jgi:hypothetical protein